MPETAEIMPVKVKDWNGKFAQNPDEWFFGREPSEMARLTLNYWRTVHGDATGTVLDHGCGEGRDSVFFAEKGFAVTAVDGAASAVEKLKRLSAEKGGHIAKVCNVDVRTFDSDVPFDIVLSHNCIQFLGDDCLPELRRLQRMTAPGGLTSVSAFTRESEALAGQADLYRFDHNELKFRFEGWRLLIYGEHVLWRDPAKAYLSFAHIIAQNPE
jgi:tellurite methyltransferase